MKCDGPSRSPVPLTAIESARRASALKANQESHQPTAGALYSEMLEEVAGVAEVGSEGTDEHRFGRRTARFLIDCRRDVALASEAKKKIVFQDVANKLGQAVTGQWLPKSVMMDRLLDIAEAHGSFGLNPEQLQRLIADAAQAIQITPAVPTPAPLKRRLITHRASEVQPEKLIWVWPGRIPEGKLVLLGGPPGLGRPPSWRRRFQTAEIGHAVRAQRPSAA